MSAGLRAGRFADTAGAGSVAAGTGSAAADTRSGAGGTGSEPGALPSPDTPRFQCRPRPSCAPEAPVPVSVFVALLALLLAGAAILAYPPLSCLVNNASQTVAAQAYVLSSSTSTESNAGELAAAYTYNQALVDSGLLFVCPLNDDGPEGGEDTYRSLLSGTSAMAVLEIPAIGVDLPVYHGTQEDSLSRGVGHLPSTSLPVGGKGTHCILTGHTGLPGKTLFTNLDKLVVGDAFVIRVLGEELRYLVDRIDVVLPEDTDVFEYDPDRDYVTLVTCTPYGVNDHRLLVRGVRAAEGSGDPGAVLTLGGALPRGLSAIEVAQLVAAAVAVALFCAFVAKFRAALRGARGPIPRQPYLSSR